MTKLLFEDEYATIYDYSSSVQDTILAYWSDAPHRDDKYLESLSFTLNCFQHKKMRFMISDHSNSKNISQAALDKIQEWYFPNAIKHGLLAEIIIEPKSYIGKLSFGLMYDEMTLKYNNNHQLLTPHVNCLSDAERWIEMFVAKEFCFAN